MKHRSDICDKCGQMMIDRKSCNLSSDKHFVIETNITICTNCGRRRPIGVVTRKITATEALALDVKLNAKNHIKR